MFMSNRGPMLGTLTAQRHGATYRRIDRASNPGWRRAESRKARLDERRQFLDDLLDEEFSPELERRADEAAMLDAEASMSESVFDWQAERELDDLIALSDLHAEGLALLAAFDVAEARREAALFRQDVLDAGFGGSGWGEAFDPDDVQWGFSVRERA